MNFLDLPEDILIIIIRDLDIKSLYNLHKASKHVRKLIRTSAIIKKCNLSLSVMATDETFKLNFFKDMSHTLKELNISGVYDLSKTNLLLALRRMKCLLTLDVSYTKIDILDLVEIHQECPSIKNICIDFKFDVATVVNNILQFQEMFGNFFNVHFVGNISLLYTCFAYYILKNARLKSLQFTVSNNCNFSICYEDFDKINPPFDNFTVDIMKSDPCELLRAKYGSKSSYGSLSGMPIFPLLGILDYEILIIMIDNTSFPVITIHSTSIFKIFFNEYFNVTPQLINEMSDLQIRLEGSIYIRFWKKNSTKFDSKFFSTLWYRLKSLIPYYFGKLKAPVPSQYEWYITCPLDNENEHKDNLKLRLKKKKNIPPNHELNYDAQFQKFTTVQLVLAFNGSAINTVTISQSCGYLRKLTFLSLSGLKVCYSTDFFNILFRSCEKLVTLNIDVPSVTKFYGALSHSLPSSQSLKNLRLVDRRIDLESLYAAISQCRTLENVQIMDTNLNAVQLFDPYPIFKNCVNLYCLYMHVSCSINIKEKLLQILNKAKAGFSRKINVNVFDTFYCDPYCNVFNIFSLKLGMNI